MPIIDVETLRTRMEQGGEVALLDTRSLADVARGVIPEAQPVDLYSNMLARGDGAELTAYVERAIEAIRNAGFTNDGWIVTYGASSDMHAARAAWTLEWLGHARVYMLDGGVEAWEAAGQVLVPRGPVAATGTFVADRKDEVLITGDELACRLNDARLVVIDVRGYAEFLGTEESECDPRVGRMPGALWLYWRELCSNGKFVDSEEARALLRDRAIEAEKELVVYCHRGARAAHTWVALRSLGFTRVRNYLGSWHEWSRRDDLPVVTGPVGV